MALAIHSSSPPAINQQVNTQSTATTASFTPPANSLLLVMWCGNASSASNVPPSPTITDNLATHLTYSLVQLCNPSTAGITTIGGQAAIWTAPVTTSAAMTVTVTNQAASGDRQAGLLVQVLTGANNLSPVEVSGVGHHTPAGIYNQSYTPTVSSGTGFLCVVDWPNNTSSLPTAASGSTLITGSFVQSNGISAHWLRRTTMDDVAGTANSLGVSSWFGSDAVMWAYAAISPAVTNPAGLMPFFL